MQPPLTTVPVQPMTNQETRRGAWNRALRASEAYQQQYDRRPDFAVGLVGRYRFAVRVPRYHTYGDSGLVGAWPQEGGVEEEGADDSTDSPPALPLYCFAWMAVLQPGTEKVSFAKTGSFPLPQEVSALVRSGVELGVADDRVFNRFESKKKDGVVGILTKGVIDRSEYYRHALILAMIPFLNGELY
jgi:non-canonical (house-cleaning) NTP pyrophosphatase